MHPLVFLPIAVTLLGWLLAAVSSLELAVRHPAEGRDLLWYAFNGIAFMDPGNFAESGAAAHQRMLLGLGGFFFGIVFTGLAVVVLGG